MTDKVIELGPKAPDEMLQGELQVTVELELAELQVISKQELEDL